jgi:hypothetical protein
MDRFKYGKKRARAGAVKLKLRDYLDLSQLPTPPVNFGHYGLETQPWGMLGNDQYGDCYWAGACHEHMLFGAMSKQLYSFSTDNALAAYSAATGFNESDSNTDQGTDMQEGAAFRQKTGIADFNGNVHKVAAYLSLEPGNINEQMIAAYLFGAVGLGFEMPESAQDQFNADQPWDVVAGSTIEGGHYVPLMGRNDINGLICTWGKIQPFTPAFHAAYNDEAIVYLSNEIFSGDKTIDGFNLAQLQTDLKNLQG